METHIVRSELGKCLVCGVEVMRNGRPLSNWRQVGYIVDYGAIEKRRQRNVLFIALCENCHISPDRYGEALSALNEAMVPPISGQIVGESGHIDTFVDILIDAQRGKCAAPVKGKHGKYSKCGKRLGKNYVLNGNRVFCERCHREGKHGKHGKPSGGKIAKAYMESNGRRKALKNAQV